MDEIKSQEEILTTLISVGQEVVGKKADIDYRVKGGGTLYLKVKTQLSLPEVIAFVDQVVKISTSPQGGFMPELLSFAFGISTLQWFAGVALPETVEEQYALVFGTGLCDSVLEKVDPDHLDGLQEAVEYRLAHMVEDEANLKLVQTLDKASGLLESLGGLTSSMDPQEMGGVMGLIREFAAKDGTAEEKATAMYLAEMRAETEKLKRTGAAHAHILDIPSETERKLILEAEKVASSQEGVPVVPLATEKKSEEVVAKKKIRKKKTEGSVGDTVVSVIDEGLTHDKQQ